MLDEWSHHVYNDVCRIINSKHVGLNIMPAEINLSGLQFHTEIIEHGKLCLNILLMIDGILMPNRWPILQL